MLPLRRVRSPAFVELCAGSAAVSMASRGTSPPCRYMGGKGRLASTILREMGVGYRPDTILLIDPGPWGRVWRVLSGAQEEVGARLDVYAEHEDHGAMWSALATEPVPSGDVEYAAAFLALQHLNWRSKPIEEREGKWRTSGLDRTMAYGLPGTDKFGEVRPQLLSLPGLVRALDLDGVTAMRCSAAEVQPIPGAVVYIDPPYQGTQGYGHDLDRAAVLGIADRWRQAGCTVAISEAEPIPGAAAVRVGQQGASQGLHDGARRVEWLSLFGA